MGDTWRQHYEGYEGLFHVLKLPRLNSLLTPPQPMSSSYLIKVHRRRLVLDPLHTPPEQGGDRSAAATSASLPASCFWPPRPRITTFVPCCSLLLRRRRHSSRALLGCRRRHKPGAEGCQRRVLSSRELVPIAGSTPIASRDRRTRASHYGRGPPHDARTLEASALHGLPLCPAARRRMAGASAYRHAAHWRRLGATLPAVRQEPRRRPLWTAVMTAQLPAHRIPAAVARANQPPFETGGRCPEDSEWVMRATAGADLHEPG